jgi:hypothetical protein
VYRYLENCLIYWGIWTNVRLSHTNDRTLILSLHRKLWHKTKDLYQFALIRTHWPIVAVRVQLGAFGREEDERQIARDVELAGGMPTRLIEQQDGVASRRDLLGDFIEMQLHRLGVALGQDQADRLAFFRADDVGRGGALVARRRGPRSTLGPAAGDLVLLSDAGFVGEPDFYIVWLDALFVRDFLQASRETF